MWISEMSFVDLPLKGSKFTWRRNNLKSRIDRGLCDGEWVRWFSNITLLSLKRSLLDHNLILMKLEDSLDCGPKSLRCYDAWFTHLVFKANM